MTSGPVYVGAFVLFLFVLGCFIVKGPLKWALIGVTFFSIVLSWGKNFMPLTDFFIDYVPLYNKFRAVSSILVIAEFTIPLLAIFALKRLLEEPEILNRKRSPSASACCSLQASPCCCHCPGQHWLRLRARPRGTDAAECRQPADDTRQRTLRHPCQLGRDACRTRQQRRPA